MSDREPSVGNIAALQAQISALRTQLEAASRDIALHKGLAGDFRKQADAALSQLGREREALDAAERLASHLWQKLPTSNAAATDVWDIWNVLNAALASPPTTREELASTRFARWSHGESDAGSKPSHAAAPLPLPAEQTCARCEAAKDIIFYFVDGPYRDIDHGGQMRRAKEFIGYATPETKAAQLAREMREGTAVFVPPSAGGGGKSDE